MIGPSERARFAWRGPMILLAALLLAACFDSPSDHGPIASRPHDGRTFFVVAGQPAFTALVGATAHYGTYEGIHGEAAYRIEVPDAWNGVLVMYAHGYRGPVPGLTVSTPSLRGHLIASGYAWAASSYSANYYDVRAGVEDTNALALAFESLSGRAKPTKYLIMGQSMGGHITGAVVERETLASARSAVRYAGAVPMCGVMGDNELYNYFIAYNVAAHELAGTPVESFPITDHAAKLPAIEEALWVDYDADRGAMTLEGEELRHALMHLSGGPRPVFDEAFADYQDLLLGYGGTDGTWNGILGGNAVNTREIDYQLDGDLESSWSEDLFNGRVFRVGGDFLAHNRPRADGVRAMPIVWGRFDVPVVTLHTLGDLWVPVRMQQVYAERARANGSAAWLVQRVVRDATHCGFTLDEQIAAFEAMVRWEEDGVIPEGDDVLDPAVVADPRYGCAFTSETRPGLAAC